MADQWNITLGARYSYDVKGMTYHNWFKFSRCAFSANCYAPNCTDPTVTDCDDLQGNQTFVQSDPATWYTTTEYAEAEGCC